jgi:hypothetical protein
VNPLKKERTAVEKPYYTIHKNDTQALVHFLTKNGQVLLPMVELIEQSQLAMDQLIDVLGRASIAAVLRLSAAGIAGPPHPGKKGGTVGGMAEVGERIYQILPLRFAGDLHSPPLGTFGEVSLED